MMPHVTLETLRRATLTELEALYAQGSPHDVPRGRFRGAYLQLVDSPGARRLENRAMVWVGFALPRFGIDFDYRAWWFHHPRVQVGAFVPRLGPSRWRDTDTVQLHYHPSRLPALVKTLLYDEVKPLTPDLCLGLGGINRPRGDGELFYFALTR